MILYYDKQGNGIDSEEWMRLMGKGDEYRRIASCEGDNVCVSTVWLGLDHNYYSDGPPIIFETLVMGGEHDDHMERYSTLDDAIEGHNRIWTMVNGQATGCESGGRQGEGA